MPHEKLTAKSIIKLEPPKTGDIVYWDTHQASPPGLGLRITSTNKRSWTLVYRFKGKQKRLTWDARRVPSLADARQFAREAHAKVARGEDPSLKKKQKQTSTVFDLLSEYLKRKQPELSSASLENWQWMTKKIAKYPIADMASTEVRQSHLFDFAEEFVEIQRQEAIAKGKNVGERYSQVYANRCCQFIKIVFSWAVERGKAGLEFNPLAGMKKPFKEESSRDALTEDELSTLVPSIQGMDVLYRTYFMLLLLTGGRSSETRLARWEDIDFKHKIWTKPKKNTKKGREHIVPLTDEMISLLRALQFRTGKSEWLFPSPDKEGQPIARPSYQTNKLTKIISGWVPHEFRNTVITGLEALCFPRVVVAAVVGHTMKGQTEKYNTYDYLRQKREALQIWGEFLGEIVAGRATYESGFEFMRRKTANVV